jgi:prevent-host-death family protein
VKTVGAYEAKTHFSRLLDEVAKGETVTITKHGMPVAVLVPHSVVSAIDVGAEIEDWIKFRNEQNITLGDVTIQELIEEGRR